MPFNHIFQRTFFYNNTNHAKKKDILTDFSFCSLIILDVYRFVEDESGNPILSKVGTDEEFEIVAETFNELQDEAMYEELGAYGSLKKTTNLPV